MLQHVAKENWRTCVLQCLTKNSRLAHIKVCVGQPRSHFSLSLFSLSLPFSCSLSLTLCLTVSLSCSLTLSLAHSLTLSLTIVLSFRFLSLGALNIRQKRHMDMRRIASYSHNEHNETRCNILPYTATRCNTLQHTATHCNTLRYTATKDTVRTCTHRNQCEFTDIQHNTSYCNAPRHTATHCNTLQHTETYCNIQ